MVTTQRGQVTVNSRFQTSVANIYAIGDLIDGPMLAHKASEEGVAAAEIIAGLSPSVNYLAVPNIIYTHPEVVALDSQKKKPKRLSSISSLGHALSEAIRGRAAWAKRTASSKVIGEKTSGQLIGLHILGPMVPELSAEGMLAIEKKATVEELATSPNGHPTLSEAVKEACLAALGRAMNL